MANELPKIEVPKRWISGAATGMAAIETLTSLSLLVPNTFNLLRLTFVDPHHGFNNPGEALLTYAWAGIAAVLAVRAHNNFLKGDDPVGYYNSMKDTSHIGRIAEYLTISPWRLVKPKGN